MRRRWSVFAVVGLVVAISGLAPARPSAFAASYVPTDEARVLVLVNATRSSKGLAPLRYNPLLAGMARRQSDRMAAKGGIFHNSDLGGEATRIGLNWQRIGENVGMGTNVDLIEDAFLKSIHHYENIVQKAFDSAGIGVVRVNPTRVYVTQVFAGLAATVPDPPARLPVPTSQAAADSPPSSTPRPQRTPLPTPAPAGPEATKRAVLPNAAVGGLVNPVSTPVSAPSITPSVRPSQPPDQAFWDDLVDLAVFWR